MNSSLLWRVYLKDLYFNRWLVIGALVVGLGALLMAPTGRVAFYVSSITLICVLILHNVFLVFSGVQTEKKEKTQLFVLSLPVSTAQWGVAKHLANFTSYFVPWLILLTATIIMIDRTPVPNGFIPFTLNVFTFVLAYYCILLGVALVGDSQAWNTSVMIAGNIGLNFTIPYMLGLPSTRSYISTERIEWNPELVWILAVQLGVAALAVLITFYLFLRKKDFI